MRKDNLNERLGKRVKAKTVVRERIRNMSVSMFPAILEIKQLSACQHKLRQTSLSLSLSYTHTHARIHPYMHARTHTHTHTRNVLEYPLDTGAHWSLVDKKKEKDMNVTHLRQYTPKYTYSCNKHTNIHKSVAYLQLNLEAATA